MDEANALIERVIELSKQVFKLRGEGNYAAALPLAEQSLALAEKGVGPGMPPDFFNPLVATAANNLAEIYKLRGDYKRAEPLLQRALAIREKVFGPESNDVAASVGNVGSLHFSRGEHARAEALHRRSLALNEKNLGPCTRPSPARSTTS